MDYYLVIKNESYILKCKILKILKVKRTKGKYALILSIIIEIYIQKFKGKCTCILLHKDKRTYINTIKYVLTVLEESSSLTSYIHARQAPFHSFSKIRLK